VKLLESLRIRAASAVRRRAGRLAPARMILGDKPGRLDLRLDALDAPPAHLAVGAAASACGAPLDLDAWQERVVDFVQWAGPAPVRITAAADHALLPELVRFCHRLEMPTRVRTGPQGLGEARAEELLDRGMATCELVARSVGEAEDAARALVRARHSRAAPLRLVLELPTVTAEDSEAARGLGIDSVLAAAGWLGGDGAPGRPRSGGRCPVAATRLEVGPGGTLSICPFKAGGTAARLPEAAAELAGHRAAIRACARECHHPELV
jgi:hypothetical protein